MLSCTNRVLSQASMKNSILHTIFKKEVKQSQQNYHTVGIVSKKLIRQCQTKGTWGILRTLQTKCTLALEMITIAPCCGKNQVLKISNQGPPMPQPSHYQLCHFLVLEKQLLSSLYISVSGKNLLKALAPGYYWLDQARSWF